MDKKTTNPFLYDLNQIFQDKNVPSIARLTILAIFSRNGFFVGLCSDEILKDRTGYSKDTVQRACIIIEALGLACFWIGKNNQRTGKLLLEDKFFQKYKTLFATEEFNKLKSSHYAIYTGTIISKDLNNNTLNFISITDSITYKIACSTKEDPLLHIRVNTKIRIQATKAIKTKDNSSLVCSEILMVGARV